MIQEFIHQIEKDFETKIGSIGQRLYENELRIDRAVSAHLKLHGNKQIESKRIPFSYVLSQNEILLEKNNQITIKHKN